MTSRRSKREKEGKCLFWKGCATYPKCPRRAKSCFVSKGKPEGVHCIEVDGEAHNFRKLSFLNPELDRIGQMTYEQFGVVG